VRRLGKGGGKGGRLDTLWKKKGDCRRDRGKHAAPPEKEFTDFRGGGKEEEVAICFAGKKVTQGMRSKSGEKKGRTIRQRLEKEEIEEG